jgi:hypothetical protein
VARQRARPRRTVSEEPHPLSDRIWHKPKRTLYRLLGDLPSARGAEKEAAGNHAHAGSHPLSGVRVHTRTPRPLAVLAWGASDRLAIVPKEESPPHPSLFTLEEIEHAVTRAGQLVYGSDERLDHLVNETRRLLKQAT